MVSFIEIIMFIEDLCDFVFKLTNNEKQSSEENVVNDRIFILSTHCSHRLKRCVLSCVLSVA